MSSIMRRRNGLMASSVIGMLLSLGEGCEPLISRQDAPLRYLIGPDARRSALPRERFSPLTLSGQARDDQIKTSSVSRNRNNLAISFLACSAEGKEMNDSRKRPVVLIVEDELLIRLDAIEMIEAAGFDTLEAADAEEAIAILEARPDIHVLFTDIHMLGSMDGVKLAHFVRNRWPPVKIIATSAHARIEGYHLPNGGRFLPKPYSAREVATHLKDLTNL
jgi:CheY-like chemotaxis protein